MGNYNVLHEKYQKSLVRVGFLVASIVLAIEVLMFYYCMVSPDVPVDTAPPMKFLLKYVLLPSGINFAAVIIASVLVKSKKVAVSAKSYVVMAMLTVLAACIEIVHYYFVPVLSVFIIVIFSSVIFQNKKITVMVYGVSYFALFGVVFMVKLYQGDRYMNLWQNILISATLLYISFVIARIIINLQNERERMARFSNEEKQELKQQLMKDPLTNLYNSQAFFSLLASKCVEHANATRKLQLAIIDVDNFTNVIETYGYLNSNNVIVNISQLLCNNLPDNAVIARYDGKRFAVLFIDETTDKASKWIENVRFILADNDISVGDETVKVTFSSGVTQYDSTKQTDKDFFEMTNRALYTAKAQGKNQTVVL